MQPDGSESDSMADYSTSVQPDKADIQEKVQSVSVSFLYAFGANSRQQKALCFLAGCLSVNTYFT